MKKFLLVIMLSVLSIGHGRAQEVSDSLSMTESVVVDSSMVSMPLAEFKLNVNRETQGQSEMLVGVIGLGTGLALSSVPVIYKEATGKESIGQDGLYALGASFACVGLIYTILGAIDWHMGSKQFKNVLVKYTSGGLTIEF